MCVLCVCMVGGGGALLAGVRAARFCNTLRAKWWCALIKILGLDVLQTRYVTFS